LSDTLSATGSRHCCGAAASKYRHIRHTCSCARQCGHSSWRGSGNSSSCKAPPHFQQVVDSDIERSRYNKKGRRIVITAIFVSGPIKLTDGGDRGGDAAPTKRCRKMYPAFFGYSSRPCLLFLLLTCLYFPYRAKCFNHFQKLFCYLNQLF